MLLHPNDTLIPVDLTRKLGGDLASAYVGVYLHTRAQEHGYDHDGRRWYRTSAPALADSLGVTPGQVRRCLARLIDRGLLHAEKHRIASRRDQTLSYTTDVVRP